MNIHILVDNDTYIRDVDLAQEFPNSSFPPNTPEDQLPPGVKNCRIPPIPNNPYAQFYLSEPRLAEGVWTKVWESEQLPEYQIQQVKQNKFDEIRIIRDELMSKFDWRYQRYNRETRLGLPTSDSIEKLDEYMQELADITTAPDPFNITWPLQP